MQANPILTYGSRLRGEKTIFKVVVAWDWQRIDVLRCYAQPSFVREKALFRRAPSRQRILRRLNLEDTPPDDLAPSRLRDLRDREAGFCFTSSCLQIPRAAARLRHVFFARVAVRRLPAINSDFLGEVSMSARNGDKSRFHRERKQKIARRKRTHELVQRTGSQAKSTGSPKATKPATVTV